MDIATCCKWLFANMSHLMKDHLQTLADYQLVQGSKSFEMSNALADLLNKGRQ